MPLKVFVDTLDGIDEKYQDLYVEKEGKFELQIEDVLFHPAVKKLKDESGARRISEKKARDELTGITSKLNGKTVEELLTAIDRIPELEAAAEGKLDEAKIQELVEKRIGYKTGPLQRKLDEALKGVTDRDAVIAEYVGKEKTRSIHDAVNEAIGKAQGFQTSAIEDARMYAERHFEIDEDGKIVTPGIDAVVWLTEMQVKKPHWWGDTKGGGAGGGKSGGNFGKNPFSREHWNLTEQGRILTENVSRAEQLAKAAGTTVGGGMPAK